MSSVTTKLVFTTVNHYFVLRIIRILYFVKINTPYSVGFYTKLFKLFFDMLPSIFSML